MYKTGIETKQTIIGCAKKLFRENGYKNTSVQMICRAAGAKLGTFTYYFPKKNDLLSPLYRDYMQKCIDYVNEKKPGLTGPEHHLMTVMLYYCHLYSDPAVISFHREVMELGSMNVWFHDPRSLIEGFSGGREHARDEKTFNLFVKADNAVRRELNLNFICSEDHSMKAVLSLMKDIYTINARLFDVDEALIQEYLKRAYRFAEKHQDADISLL